MSNFTRRSVLALTAAAPLSLALASTARAASHEVTISSFKFDPAVLQVAVGDTVRFTNEDTAPHTATAKAGAFDTGTLGKGQSANVTITEAGDFAYKCNFHPRMKGTIRAS